MIQLIKSKWIEITFMLLAIPLIYLVVLFSMKWFTSKTVSHRLIEPKPGVECVVVTTTDGVATDCWKVEVPSVDLVFSHHSCAVGGKDAG